ncbi:MAG: GatB/YqeY domain-containing protein [Chloroflexi bacterium]|nr:GatB/YqeY domain-containing protein [Chloroflexota bacterium]
MNLQERLMADLQDAMRANDGIRKDAIRMLRAAIKNAEIAAQHELDDSQVQQLVARDIKHREEAIALLRRANRPELVQVEEASIKVLQGYLPQQISREQVEQVVREVIANLDARDTSQLGSVMREAMARLKGQADGRMVNELVREYLKQ